VVALPEPVDIGSLGRIIQALQDNLKAHARQGADEQTALDSQFIAVSEEAGEAAESMDLLDPDMALLAALLGKHAGRISGAYRRWRGFARRAGTSEDVYSELADVIIVAMVAITHFHEVAEPDDEPGDPGDMIEIVLKRKLDKIFSRGYVNKEAKAERPFPWRCPEGCTEIPCSHDPDPDMPGWRRDGYKIRRHRPWCGDPSLSRPENECTCHITPEQQTAENREARELNPDTGRPWTQHEAASYDALMRQRATVAEGMNPVPAFLPNGVWIRKDDGSYQFLGTADKFNWQSLTPPYVIVLGKDPETDHRFTD
jgi:hypothetical protein